MKKKALVLLIIFPIIAILSIGVVLHRISNASTFFDPGERYDWSKLDYMNVIYENRSDIRSWNEGYSETESCPWGFIHNGLDFFFENESNVIAAAPGQVQEIEMHQYEGENMYHIRIWIRFNDTVMLGYNFEPWTDVESNRDKQIDMFQVSVGDWVIQGQVIARFLECAESAHIHFDVIENNQRYCPTRYFSQEGYDEIMELVHSFHPSWELCYV